MPRSSSVKIVRVPTFSSATKRRAAGLARRGYSAAASAAKAEKHTFAAVGAAAVLGYLQKTGVSLPKVDALGASGTYGMIAWAAGRYMKSQVLGHVATGLLSVAAYQFGRGEGISGEDAGAL